MMEELLAITAIDRNQDKYDEEEEVKHSILYKNWHGQPSTLNDKPDDEFSVENYDETMKTENKLVPKHDKKHIAL